MRALLRVPGEWCRGLIGGWNRFWFTPADPTTLAAVRICTGLVLLYVHLACVADLTQFVGPSAWVDRQAMAQIKALGQDAPDIYGRVVGGWWGQSIWDYIQDPALVWGTYGLFLAAVLCFTLGLYSRVAAVAVWVGHLSYIQRGFAHWHGTDIVLVMLTFYMMFGPTGAALSLDQVRARFRAAGHALGAPWSSTPGGQPPPSWTANMVIRMIQIHMCVMYLFAGLSKLQGARWWDGSAVWLVMVDHEFLVLDFSWLANGGDWLCLLVSGLGVFLTLALEIGFTFLVWNRSLRPLILLLAVLLHASIGLVMGLGAFGAAMLTGCLAFVDPATIRRGVDWLCRATRTSQQVPAAPRKTARAA